MKTSLPHRVELVFSSETSMQLKVALLKQKILWQNFPLTPQVIYIRGINVFIAWEHSPSTRHA